MKLIKKLKEIIFGDKESRKLCSIVFSFILIAVSIACIFRSLPYGEELKISDYFNFAGSFGGAIFGGFISLIILKVSLEKQQKQFDEERKKDLELKSNEDKLLMYKENYKICKVINNIIKSFIINIKTLSNDPESPREVLELFSNILNEVNSLTTDFKFYSLLLDEKIEIFDSVGCINKEIEKLYLEFENNYFAIEAYERLIFDLSCVEDKINKCNNYIISRCNDINKKKFQI